VLSKHEIELRELSRDECARLLTEHSVGRLAVVVGGRPLIFPVNYVFDGGSVVFRTDDGLKLRHAPLRRVAFEIDGFDEATGTGWSVLVQGSPFEITRADDLRAEELRRLPVAPFAPGEKAHWIEIVTHTITGRRLEARTDVPGTQLRPQPEPSR
jgi:nitroimidazol reductase NimA-like FMN-containing flavoprotein (pyridoxamine 5'-phosphate oxidase superfamily)